MEWRASGGVTVEEHEHSLTLRVAQSTSLPVAEMRAWQDGHQLRCGESYVISGSVLYDVPAALRIHLQQATSPHTPYFTEELSDLGCAARQFSKRFVMSKPSDTQTQLHLQLSFPDIKSPAAIKVSDLRITPLKGRLVFAGPAGGKTYLCSTNPHTVYDSERIFPWKELQSYGYHLGPSQMAEESLELTSLFFDYCLPIIMLALKTERICVSSLVSMRNFSLVRWLVRGLSAHHDISVLKVDEGVLEERVRGRYQSGKAKGPVISYAHRGLLHSQAIHAILHVLEDSTGASLRKITSADFESLPVGLQCVPLAELPQSRYRSFAWREPKEGKIEEHVAIEVLPHFYVELVDQVPFYYLCVDMERSTRSELFLVCTKQTERCLAMHGGKKCTIYLRLTDTRLQVCWKEGSEREARPLHRTLATPISLQGILTYKLQLPPRNNPKRVCALAFYGSFAPLHRGHLEALEVARNFAAQSYHVLGAYVCPHARLYEKEAMFSTLWPWRHRAAMVEFALEGVPYAMLDHSCLEWPNSRLHPIWTLAARVRAATGIADVEVLWVNGTDPSFSDSVTEEALHAANIRILFVQRGSQMAPARFGDRELRAPAQLSAYSSTQVRKLLQSGHFNEAAKVVGDQSAFAYLLWLYHEQTKRNRI